MGELRGSPPRAWGRLEEDHDQPIVCLRFTPTCVGTAGTPYLEYLADVCGRFTPTCVGTASAMRDASASARFTPTCVGTAGRRQPHAPGTCWSYGSPPRAWGRLCQRRVSAGAQHGRHGSPPRAWGRHWKLADLSIGFVLVPRVAERVECPRSLAPTCRECPRISTRSPARCQHYGP